MKKQLSKSLLYLMAITAGSSVGGIFLSQPILPLLRDFFQITTKQVGLVPTMTQIGYALGIMLIIPLGDMISRRKLVITMTTLTALSSLILICSPNFWSFLFASTLLGLVSISTQILTPLTAQLSDDTSRGRNMGIIISGMLLGVLLSRTIGGYLGGEFGWRSVYVFSASLNAFLTLALIVMIPKTKTLYQGTYCELMKSLYRLVNKYSTLRESMFFGAMFFAAFNCFWATLDFLLFQPPYNYGAKEAGLFGLIGAAGAFVAPLAGKISDNKDPRKTIGVGIIVSIIAFFMIWFGQAIIWSLVIGTALMDMGVQAGHVTNQTRIYSLDPSSRSRFATIYVFSYFVGGALGSAGGSWSYARWGWTGPSVLSILIFLSTAIVYLVGSSRSSKVSKVVNG